jgi:hypothetical protein
MTELFDAMCRLLRLLGQLLKHPSAKLGHTVSVIESDAVCILLAFQRLTLRAAYLVVLAACTGGIVGLPFSDRDTVISCIC